MPPPTSSASRPGRYLAALAVLVVVLFGSVIGARALLHPGSWHARFQVGLGLDLSSGTTVTLKAVPAKKGTPPSAQDMKQAISILLNRVNGAGLNGATVQQQGTDIINVSVPRKTSDEVINLIGYTAKLRFRQVLLCTTDIPGSAQCRAPSPLSLTPPPGSPSSSATPAPSGSGSASPGSSPSASRSATPSAKPSTTPSTKRSASTKARVRLSGPSGVAAAAVRAQRARNGPAAGTSQKPKAPAAPRRSATASPKPSASRSPSPSVSPSPGTTPTAGSGSVIGNPALASPAVLKLFNKLNCQSKNWPQQLQQVIYHNDPALWEEGNQIVSCGSGPDNSGVKYLLARATVTGDQLTSAGAALNPTNNSWVVNLSLNGAGTRAFGLLTTQMFSRYYNPQTQTPASPLDDFAIVLGGLAESAPFIQAAITNGQAEISGSFTQARAVQLANVLKYGELRLDFQKESVTTVSPQLGASQLQAGLIAGLVGLLLVVIYSFLYYRGLAVVSVASLAIAALLAWLTVMLLTWHAGFTLSLAGVAGLIVAIGITADSFVVFFERLRDEVREGRSLRAAVERGWARARRTILVSDTVSFLAAALLYYFAIGDVKGFAFTLGLTTLIDIVVVFLFTKPMVTLLARTEFFGRGHKLSGLDPARLGARSPWRGSRQVRPATGSAATGAPGAAAPREA